MFFIWHILILNFYLPLGSVHQFRSWTFIFLYRADAFIQNWCTMQAKWCKETVTWKCCISKFQRFTDPSRRGLNFCYVVSWSVSARHCEFQLIGAHCSHAFRHYWGQWVMNLCCIGVSGEMLLGCTGCMWFRLYWRQLSHEFNTTDPVTVTRSCAIQITSHSLWIHQSFLRAEECFTSATDAN